MKQGWEIKKLGELVTIKTGKLDSNAMVEGGKYPFFTCSREIFAINDYAFDCEAILLAGNNASGNFNVKHYKGKFNAYQRTYVITVNAENKILYSYLYQQLTNHLKRFKEQSLGANTKFLKIGMIQGMEIPLPPLPEQQRIVSILDEAFAAIAKVKANAEQNLKNAKELFESYLQGVFEKKGDGWEETSLKKEIELLVGFAFKSKEYTELQEDILLVRGDNIMQGYFRWEEAKRWSKSEYYVYEKYQLQENDIVLAMDRPWVKAGLKIARISKFEIPALLVQRTACLRTKDKLDNSFLFYLLNSKRFMQYLIDVQTGIGVPHISGQHILDFEFHKPSLHEQQTIVRQLDALRAETQKLEAVYQKKITDLEELKKSILAKAFAGELKTEKVDAF